MMESICLRFLIRKRRGREKVEGEQGKVIRDIDVRLERRWRWKKSFLPCCTILLRCPTSGLYSIKFQFPDATKIHIQRILDLIIILK